MSSNFYNLLLKLIKIDKTFGFFEVAKNVAKHKYINIFSVAVFSNDKEKTLNFR